MFQIPQAKPGSNRNDFRFYHGNKEIIRALQLWGHTQTALRDRFVCGLRDVNIQKRLLQEQNLTLDTATLTWLWLWKWPKKML
ncbi:hypothetical protein PoB_001460900 [Plakobranchus ocellatus]|uniref:Uncharacterized protein n=1 Tax=Plakobranchus ocellatus TaxID=259542 RepID=A0AAV3Z212_9GAST|nr:hypothetical protein PoB_001460900 [Plakobranchus ocellatus]